MKKIPENVELVLKALFPLVIMIILFAIVGNIGLSKVAEVRDRVANEKKDKLVLTEKLELLKTIALTGERDVNITANALPDVNPTLLVVSQLKKLAADNGLIIKSVKQSAGPSGNEEIKNVSIIIATEGAKDQLDSLITGIGTIAPLTNLEKVKITKTGELYTGEITVLSYWSSYPSKLPESVEGYNDLTVDEKILLGNLSGLTQPIFTELPPASEGGRDDPFSL